MDNLKVLITGAANGIGLATAEMFLDLGHEVIGLDVDNSKIDNDNYSHHICDVSKFDELPDIEDVNILINNAGTQTAEEFEGYCGNDIDNNLIGVINCTKKYGMADSIQSIVNLASVSAHNGAEFSEYVASKGGVLAYTKWTAKAIAPHATCNSLSFGGVLTELNNPVTSHDIYLGAILEETPMQKWMDPEECATWIYFMSVINKSCTGQDIIVDNGETYNHRFIWPGA